MENNQCVRKIVETNNLLSNHKFDIIKHKNRIINIQKKTIIIRINKAKKPLHYFLRKWKGGVTVAENWAQISQLQN